MATRGKQEIPTWRHEGCIEFRGSGVDAWMYGLVETECGRGHTTTLRRKSLQLKAVPCGLEYHHLMAGMELRCMEGWVAWEHGTGHDNFISKEDELWQNQYKIILSQIHLLMQLSHSIFIPQCIPFSYRTQSFACYSLHWPAMLILQWHLHIALSATLGMYPLAHTLIIGAARVSAFPINDGCMVIHIYTMSRCTWAFGSLPHINYNFLILYLRRGSLALMFEWHDALFGII